MDDLICETCYIKHPRLYDGSRGGLRIVMGPVMGPKTFPPPYLMGYARIARTRWTRMFDHGSGVACATRSATCR